MNKKSLGPLINLTVLPLPEFPAPPTFHHPSAPFMPLPQEILSWLFHKPTHAYWPQDLQNQGVIKSREYLNCHLRALRPSTNTPAKYSFRLLKHLGRPDSPPQKSNPSSVSSFRNSLSPGLSHCSFYHFLVGALPSAGSQYRMTLPSILQTLSLTYGACVSYPHNQIKSF